MCSNGELELNESLGIIWWAFVCLYFWQWHLTLAFDRWLERHLRWYLPFFFAAFRPNIHGQRFNRNVIGFDDRLFRLPEIRMFKCAFGDKMNDIHFIANTSDSKSQSKWKKMIAWHHCSCRYSAVTYVLIQLSAIQLEKVPPKKPFRS